MVVIAILNDWRRGLYLLVGWILFEDFVRKYLGNNMAIYFAKDALAIILYVSFFRARLAKRIEKFRIPFRIALLVFIWFGFLQMFNPASPSIFYGILGMKVYFLYVPLVFVGYAFLESEEELRRFFSFTCILILIVAGLGLAQSIIGPTFLNPSTLQEDIRELSTLYRVTSSGTHAYRPSSVFVSTGRFVDFLIVAWLVSLGYAGYLLLRSKKGRTLAFTTVGVVAAASLMSTSRGAVMWEHRNCAGRHGWISLGSSVASGRSHTGRARHPEKHSFCRDSSHTSVDDISGGDRFAPGNLFRNADIEQFCE